VASSVLLSEAVIYKTRPAEITGVTLDCIPLVKTEILIIEYFQAIHVRYSHQKRLYLIHRNTVIYWYRHFDCIFSRYL